MLKIVILIFSLIFFTACQENASSNRDTSFSPEEATLKYPIKTGQRSSFVFNDTDTNTYYTDDGDFKKQIGYERSFVKLNDGTVYNVNYDLYWQDDNASAEYNATKAEQFCSDLVLANKTDWRLPNIFELMTLLDLESRTDLRESTFEFMPLGAYFSNQNVTNTEKTIVVNFGEQDFSVTKIIKEVAYDANVTTSEYGVLFGTTTVPTYNVPSAQDPLFYLRKVVVSDIYFNAATGFQTVVSTDTFYNSDGEIDTTIKINPVGPYVESTGGTQFNPTVEPLPVSTNIKCVSGKEIGGFNFVRDDRTDTVLDRATNLVWQDNEDVVRYDSTWGRATEYCDKLTLGNYKDWRLPTISELITLNDFSFGGTYSVSNVFRYKAACKFHSSSNICSVCSASTPCSAGSTCHQSNYLLNTCGQLNDKVIQRFVNYNPELSNDINTTEPKVKTRCVRQGSYGN